MKPRNIARLWAGAVAVLAVMVFASGCQNKLAFGTATKFGLDISQRADQMMDVTMGYQRAEIVVIPMAENECQRDADKTNDAYSVLGRFYVHYGGIFETDSSKRGLRLKQFFSTGMAARAAAKNADMQSALGKAAYEVQIGEPPTDKAPVTPTP